MQHTYNPALDPQMKPIILEEKINYKGEFILSLHKGLIVDSLEATIPLSTLSDYNKVSEQPNQPEENTGQQPYEVLFITDDDGNVFKFIDQLNTNWLVESTTYENQIQISCHTRIKIGQAFIIIANDGENNSVKIAKVRQVLLRNTSRTSTQVMENGLAYSDEIIQVGGVFPVREESN